MRDLLHAAVARRAALDLEKTDAFRLVDGEGDGIPGLTIDRFGPVWLASASAEESPPPSLIAAMPAMEGVAALWWKNLAQEEKKAPRCVWLRRPPAGEAEAVSRHVVEEHGMRFHVDLEAGYSQGIFLDQRLNRNRVMQASRGRSVLNLFAYTCGFSAAVGLGGGIATSLDLSQVYLDWGRRNFEANGLDPESHHWCRGDAFDWLRRFARSGRRFGGVVLDPPTFSRSRQGKARRTFRVEDDFEHLVHLAVTVLEPGGFLLATTNCRRLSERGFRAMVEAGAGGAGELLEMPPEFRGEPYLKSAWFCAEGR